MKILIPILIALAATGCTTVQYNGGDAKATAVDRPPIGEIASAYVGDHMIEKGTMVDEPVLRVTKLIDGVAYDIPAIDYPQIGYDENRQYFSSLGVIPGPFVDPHKAIAVDKGQSKEVCVVTVFGADSCYEGDWELTRVLSRQANSFQQTLIYSGRVGDKINISYREFSNDIARPAFNNEVEYDLSQSSTITYKGAVIEVIKADNDGITYKVIKSFP